MIALAVILFVGAAYHVLGAIAILVLPPDWGASRWDGNIYLSLAGVEIVTGIGFLLLA